MTGLSVSARVVTKIIGPRQNNSGHWRTPRLRRSAFGCAIVALAVGFGGAYAMGGETVLYSFCSRANCADGGYPVAGLILDGSGNLYGTTRGGLGLPRSDAASVVFKLFPNGTEMTLYTFPGKPDGYGAQGTLIADGAGNLYGTTVWGGLNAGGGPDTTNHYGTIFKLTPSGTETVLYGFCSQANCADGGYPQTGSLTVDSSGNLYGATNRLGTNITGDAGTVFRLASDGTETTLYSFCSRANCADGRFPPGGLIADSSGNLYGTTSYGGNGGCNEGCGTVFELAANGTETVLHVFSGGSDGANPFGSLITDSLGNLYGTTTTGGANGDGTVFKVAPNGSEAVLYSFQGGTDGANPYASLITDSAGNFYGTTQYGGAANCGTVFKLAPNNTETVLYGFLGGSNGCRPQSGLIRDKSGNLYGTTAWGGANDVGTVFKLANPNVAKVQQPINADGSSVFKASRGVIPVIFALYVSGVPTCTMPNATIALTRTSGGTEGAIDESTYEMAADDGANYRVSDCQYIYNLGSKNLGTGTYRVDILIDGSVVGSGTFGLK